MSCLHHEISYIQLIQCYCLENKKIFHERDRELEHLKITEKSRMQCLEDKISLLTEGSHRYYVFV